jgi:hypothetical protein
MSEKFDGKRKEWSEKIGQWRQSGKSAQAWCRERQINYTLFITWRKRLELGSKNFQDQPVQTPFIELKEEIKDISGVYIECAGVRIYVSQDFDAIVLKKCLSVLQGT